VTPGMSGSFQAVVVAVACALAVSGCAPGSEAGKQASQGATLGAVGGAVAGAVGSLLWGGNVAEGAVKGAAVGAASGAAVGAVSGSAADGAAKDRPPAAPAGAEAKEADLRKRMGDRNYATTVLLSQCRHRDAIASAQATLSDSSNADERAYALLIQSVAAEELGDKALAGSLYPKIAQENPERGPVDKARADALEGVMKVQATRRQHGLAPVCAQAG